MDKLNCSLLNFYTSGSMAYYGFLLNLPNELVIGGKCDKNNNLKKTFKTDLYLMDRQEVDFVQNSIKGGRV